MAHFSNGTEGVDYQEKYCFRCAHWNEEYGCPIWNLHEIFVGEDGWRRALNKMIPMSGTRNLACVEFRPPMPENQREKPLTPGQEAGLKEWKGVARL